MDKDHKARVRRAINRYLESKWNRRPSNSERRREEANRARAESAGKRRKRDGTLGKQATSPISNDMAQASSKWSSSQKDLAKEAGVSTATAARAQAQIMNELREIKAALLEGQRKPTPGGGGSRKLPGNPSRPTPGLAQEKLIPDEQKNGQE